MNKYVKLIDATTKTFSLLSKNLNAFVILAMDWRKIINQIVERT